MIEEKKTHYSDTRYCNRFGAGIVVEQMKTSGTMIAQCVYYHFDASCYCGVADGGDFKKCSLVLEKLVKKVE